VDLGAAYRHERCIESGGMLHAVLIGVNASRDPTILPLDYACADAEDLADALATKERGGEARITLLVEEQATKAQIARVITDELPRRVSPDDTVLLYFAGYGSPELGDPGPEPSIHIVTHDTEQARLHATSINVLSELATWTRRLDVRAVAMILDTGFNGLPGGRSFEGPGLRSGPRTRALDRISPARAAMGPHTALLTACGEKEVAREELSHEHGVFTHHLLGALRRLDHELDRPSLRMIHQAVCEELETTPNRRQHPAIHGAASDVPLFSAGGAATMRGIGRSSTSARGHAFP